MEQQPETQVEEPATEDEAPLGVAVADLVENVIANALKIAEDVASDSIQVARSARRFVRDLRDL
jgi:hypothetical protein